MPDDQTQLDVKKKALESSTAYFAVYADYNRLLRTWFVTFGVGGPVIFLTQPQLLQNLTDFWRQVIVGLFLLGCLSQVLLALLNKYLNWIEYNYQQCCAITPALERNRLQRLSDTVSSWAWIDSLADFITLIAFAIAVFGLANAALAASVPSIIYSAPD